MKSRITLCGAVVLVATVGVVIDEAPGATPIAVGTPGFEVPDTKNNYRFWSSFVSGGAWNPHWDVSPSSNASNYNRYRAVQTLHNNQNIWDTNTPYGNQFALVSNRGGGQDISPADGVADSPTRMTQLIFDGLSQSTQPGLTYEFSTSLLDWGNVSPAFRFGLYGDAAMSDVLAELDGSSLSPSLSSDAWQEYTVQWTADSEKALYIGFENYGAGSTADDYRLGIDNVRLTFVPEPGTLGLLLVCGLVVAAAGSSRRQRRRSR